VPTGWGFCIPSKVAWVVSTLQQLPPARLALPPPLPLRVAGWLADAWQVCVLSASSF